MTDILPHLYVILDIASARAADHSVVQVARRAADGGGRFFQCRFKEIDDEANEALCREVVEAVGDRATVLVNGRPEIAAEVGAAGVHLTSKAGAVGDVRAAGLAVAGRSCHSMLEARRAADEGADFITMSPVFRSQSKPDHGPTLGLDLLASICDEVDVPVYALAGVTPGRAELCLEAGAHGVAVMSGICGADSPEGAVEAYLQALGGADA